MATETSITINIRCQRGSVSATASTAKKCIDELERFNLSPSDLGGASEYWGMELGSAGVTAASDAEDGGAPADESEPELPMEPEKTEAKPAAKAKEPEKEPEIDEKVVRGKVEALIAKPGGAVIAVKVMEDLKAFDADGRAKLSALPEDKYPEACKMLDERLAEFDQAGAGVL